MKKILSLVLAVLMLATVLCACGNTEPTTTAKPQGSTPAATNKPTEPIPTQPAGDVVINVDEFVGDASNWECDTELGEFKDGKLFFNTNYVGEYCAAMLKQPVQDGTYKLTLTVNAICDQYADYWYDTELFIIARASKAGTTWSEGEQTGYCISSWGDLGEFWLGRAGCDDAFGNFAWNVNDGQPHVIELTTKNIEQDGKTCVQIIVTVDGVEVANVIDDGSVGREGRPTMYPEGGNLVIRAKWMEITVG